MKKLVFTAILLLFQIILFAQKVTFNSVDSTEIALGQPLITEFATKAYDKYENDKVYRSRIYNYLRDHGFHNWDEITEAMTELKGNRDYLELVFEVTRRYCLGNDKNCMVKDLKGIGLDDKSANKIAHYILKKNNYQKTNYWE